MPYNIVILSEASIVCNPICDAILPIAIISFSISSLITLILVASSFDIFSFVGEIIFCILKIVWTVSVVLSFAAIIGTEFQYEDTGRKKYSVVAQTEEQIEYIYDNYDITGSDGDIYYIEERDD